MSYAEPTPHLSPRTHPLFSCLALTPLPNSLPHWRLRHSACRDCLHLQHTWGIKEGWNSLIRGRRKKEERKKEKRRAPYSRAHHLRCREILNETRGRFERRCLLAFWCTSQVQGQGSVCITDWLAWTDLPAFNVSYGYLCPFVFFCLFPLWPPPVPAPGLHHHGGVFMRDSVSLKPLIISMTLHPEWYFALIFSKCFVIDSGTLHEEDPSAVWPAIGL